VVVIPVEGLIPLGLVLLRSLLLTPLPPLNVPLLPVCIPLLSEPVVPVELVPELPEALEPPLPAAKTVAGATDKARESASARAPVDNRALD
jgi:hypothetical protein